ncbi:MAG TPA: hypothetical protein VGZ22_26515 [Isosphaeraceae bacterium]|jgi:hypothetical protein|nr:hypothetical protein [Isosphaeraceae bacterium]
MKEQADWQENDGKCRRPCQPKAASEQAAHTSRILDRHTKALQHEIQNRSSLPRVCHEADEFVVKATVEKHGQEHDFRAGAA